MKDAEVSVYEIISLLDEWIEDHIERSMQGDGEDAEYAGSAALALESFQGYLRFHYGLARKEGG